MIFFTKTCKRDTPRVLYQIRAVRRLYPGIVHIVVIEEDELTPELQAEHEVGGTRIRLAENLFPRLPIVNRYLAQQAMKLLAPIVLGTDTMQIDSDMCPGPNILLEVPAYGTTPTWHYQVARNHLIDMVVRWEHVYMKCFGLAPTSPTSPLRVFMPARPHGWFISQQTAHAFMDALCTATQTRDMCRALSRVVGHQPFSEYQMLGWWVSEHRLEDFRWIESTGKEPTWLYHFTSAGQLDGWQERLLREAAGMDTDK